MLVDTTPHPPTKTITTHTVLDIRIYTMLVWLMLPSLVSSHPHPITSITVFQNMKIFPIYSVILNHVQSKQSWARQHWVRGYCTKFKLTYNICYIFCFVDHACRYICVIKTNLMHYLSSVYIFFQPLHVLGIFVAHHQEVFCIYATVGTCCAF